MEMKHMIRILLISLVLLLQPFLSAGQRVYHVDPNARSNDTRTVQSKEDIVDADRIVVRNNYGSAVTVLVSMNNKDWDTIQIKEKNFISSKQKSMYMKVYTSETNFKMYQLAAGTLYQLYWNKDEKLWQIIK